MIRAWAIRLAVQRLLSQWRSLLTIIAGVLLSASVGALVPLYTSAVAQVGMVERLNQLPLEDVHAGANLSLIASKTADFGGTIKANDDRFREIANRILVQQFPGWLSQKQIVSYGQTSALDVDPPPEVTEPGGDPVTPDPTTRVVVAYYDGWQDVISIASGRLPADSPSDGSQADIEIVIPLEAQNNLNIAVGDVLLLDQGGPKGGWPSSKNVRAVVVGIGKIPEQPTALQRAFFMPPSPLRVISSNGQYKYEYPVLTTRTAFERVATAFVPDTPTVIGWRLLFDHARLPFTRSAEARQALFDFDHELAATFKGDPDLQFNYSTGLINWQTQNGQQVDQGALLAYEQSVKALDAPFGLLLLQVGALVIFFLLVTASLVRRGERREIAMLQSRGAVDRQIVLVRGLESLLICIFGALVAPFISQQLLILITPFFARYRDLPLQITGEVFAFSAVAAGIAFLTLALTLRPVLRQPLITSGGATLRSEQQPWWQRYYIDVILVILGVAALWRLVGKDTPLFTTTAGGRTTDPFLLLAPAFLFLGLGSLLLRLFPTLAGLVARTLAAGRGLVGPLASWQLSREPIHYGRITFLLALAIGIGWFATSFRATVQRSQTDQAEYRVGTDIRISERDIRLNAARARSVETYTRIPGITAATVVYRRPSVNFQPNPSKGQLPGELLAVDSQTFKQAAYWRPDLGNLNTPSYAQKLPDRGVALPILPQELDLWALFEVRGPFAQFVPDLDRLLNRTTIYARLLDSSGAWLRIPFKVVEVQHVSNGPQAPGMGGGGSFLTNGWAHFEADLPPYASGQVRLVSLYWQHRGRNLNGERDLHLTLAGLTATDSNGAQQPLDLFDNPAWEFASDSGITSDGNISVQDSPYGRALLATWNQSAQNVTVGLLLNYPAIASVPMIVSDSLADQLGVQAKQTIQLRDLDRLTVSFEVVDRQRYYPTLYDSLRMEGRWTRDERNHPFAVVDQGALLYALNRRPSAALYADEVWLKTAPGTDINAVLAALHDSSAIVVQANTLPGELASLRTDPLSLGLLGLMLLAFIIAMALSITGLLTYAALTAESRRTEFAVLRALGLSSLRLIRQFTFEQGFIIGLGALLGGILGAVLSNQVVPRLAQDTSSRSVTPPFIVQVETGALLQYAGVIAVVLAVVLALSLLLVSRLSLGRALRLGEE